MRYAVRILFALLLTACAADGDGNPGASDAAGADASTAADARISPSPAPTGEQDASPEPYGADTTTIVGTWIDRHNLRYDFTSSGEFLVQGGNFATASYTFDGEMLVLETVESDESCPGNRAEYEVFFDEEGDVMEFDVIQDDCSIQRDHLQFGSLRRTD